MNIDAIDRTIDRIGELPDEFYMPSWYSFDGVEDNGYWDEDGDWVEEMVRRDPADFVTGVLGTTTVPMCGATACLAGEGVLANCHDLDRYREVVELDLVGEEACQVWGIDYAEYGNWLFHNSTWPYWVQKMDLEEWEKAIVLMRIIREGHNPSDLCSDVALNILDVLDREDFQGPEPDDSPHLLDAIRRIMADRPKVA